MRIYGQMYFGVESLYCMPCSGFYPARRSREEYFDMTGIDHQPPEIRHPV